MIPTEKLAWMAAVFDLRCHVVVKTNATRATPQMVLVVQSVHHHVVAELCRLTGTQVEPRRRRRKDFMRRGCQEHCPEAHVHMTEDEYLPATSTWTITGSAAAIVLTSVIPYMVTDRGTARMVQYCMENLVTTGQGVGQVRSSTRRLAALGWDIPAEMQHLLEPVARAS